MMLRKCSSHEKSVYTLKDSCPICKEPTKEAHYKFIKVRDAPKDDRKED